MLSLDEAFMGNDRFDMQLGAQWSAGTTNVNMVEEEHRKSGCDSIISWPASQRLGSGNFYLFALFAFYSHSQQGSRNRNHCRNLCMIFKLKGFELNTDKEE